MSWFSAAPAVLAALVLIGVTGGLVVAPLRLGFVATAAAAGPAAVGAVGLAGLIFGAVRLPWASWQPLLVATVVGTALWVSLGWRRSGPSSDGSEADSRRWLMTSWLLSALIIALVSFAAVPEPNQVSQTYDNVFHMSAIASILNGGDASSLTLRTLVETDKSIAFYPAAWHALVASVAQLSGSSATLAANASWIAVAAAIWVPGAAWLAQTVLHEHRQRVVALVALPIAAAFGAMPYSLLSWGTLYPTFLATALMPAAIATTIISTRAVGSARPGARLRITLWALAATASGVGAIVFAQPRALATWALILSPAIISVSISWLRAAWKVGPEARRLVTHVLVAVGLGAVVITALGVAYLVFELDLLTRPLGERLGGPQALATQSLIAGVAQVLSQSWPTGVAGFAVWASPLLAIAVIIGAVLAARTRSLRWVVVGYGLVALLYVLAAGSDDVISKLVTAAWYKDRYRLSSAVPVLGVTLASLGVLRAASWVSASRRLGAAAAVRFSTAGAWIVAVSSALVLGLTGVSGSIAAVFALPASRAGDAVVSSAQIQFMSRLPEQVPQGERVLGDPWDGSAWSLLFGDREPVFPHVNGQWDPDRLDLAYRLDSIETDPAVCDSLDALKVRYVLYNPHEFGGGDPSGNHFAAIHRAVELGLFTAVSTDGNSTLFRIDQCGPLVSSATP